MRPTPPEPSTWGQEGRQSRGRWSGEATGRLARSGLVWAQAFTYPAPHNSGPFWMFFGRSPPGTPTRILSEPLAPAEGAGSRKRHLVVSPGLSGATGRNGCKLEVVVLGCSLREKKKVSKSVVCEPALLPPYSREMFGRVLG